MKLGLALAGGGMRGIAHAGFLKALEENDIKIDGKDISVYGTEVHHINVLRHKIGDLIINRKYNGRTLSTLVSIIDKINGVAKEIYRANNVIINNELKEKIKVIEENGFGNLPICIAKTQYSFSDNPKLLGAPENFNMTVTDIRLCSGAGFIVVLMGNIMTMPGLAKKSAYLNMDIDNNGNIEGLF